MRVYRNESPPGNMHFVTGVKVGASNPYNQHRFVYISPEGTKAHYGNITLLIWSRMCHYFSNNTIQTDAAADDKDTTTFRQHFEVYTTLKATPANITAAFEKGVMKCLWSWTNNLLLSHWRHEKQVKLSLEYFHRLCSKQQERRKSGDKNWEAQFLASETWKNLRITCRGFYLYCRSVIDYARRHTNIKFYAVSPAHANSNCVRGDRGSVPNYSSEDDPL